jgi:hypothetical protein
MRPGLGGRIWRGFVTGALAFALEIAPDARDACAQSPPAKDGDAGAKPSAPKPGAPGAVDTAALADALKRGAAAARKHDFAACVKAYEEALRIQEQPTTFGELGLCEEAVGRHVEADDHLARALENEPAPALGGQRGRWAQYRMASHRELERVAHVFVTLAPPVPDVELFLDGVSMGTNVLGRIFGVAPGEHTWVGRRAGYKDGVYKGTVRGRDPAVEIILSLVPLPKPAEEPPCDKACQQRIHDEAEREGARKAQAEVDARMAKLRADLAKQQDDLAALKVAVVNGRPVDPAFSLFAGGVFGVGLALDVNPGFVLGGGARFRGYDEIGFSVDLEAKATLPTKITRGLGTIPPLDISQVTAALVPCLRYRWIAGCGFVDAGMIIPSTQGPLSGAKIHETVGLGPRLMVDLPIVSGLGIRAFADLRFLLTPRYGAYDTNTNQEWREPPVTGLFGLAISYGQPVTSKP